jgi:hypothetical protein
VETWVLKDKKELLISETDATPTTITAAFDGSTMRILTVAKGSPMIGEISIQSSAIFARQAWQPHGLTGRYIWERPLVAALQAGNVTVTPTLVSYLGSNCYELAGHMASKAQDGADAMWFKLLLDADRGCMPRYVEGYIQDAQGKTVVRNIHDEYVLKEISAGIWFPQSCRERSLQVDMNGQWQTTVLNQVHITSVKVNEAIADGRFALAFPDGTQVTDMRKSTLFPKRYVVGATTAPAGR